MLWSILLQCNGIHTKQPTLQPADLVSHEVQDHAFVDPLSM